MVFQVSKKMLEVTRTLKLYNRMALSGPKLYSILLGELDGYPIYAFYLEDTVAKTLHEMTLFNINSSGRADCIKFWEQRAKNLQKVTLLNCNTRSEAYKKFYDADFFHSLRELHLDGVHLDPDILDLIIQTR